MLSAILRWILDHAIELFSLSIVSAVVGARFLGWLSGQSRRASPVPRRVEPHLELEEMDVDPSLVATDGGEGEGALYPVWFGTNRDFSNSAGSRDLYRVGLCLVRIPKSHRIGSTGSPLWRRILLGMDDRLALAEVKRMGAAPYWRQLATIVSVLTEGRDRVTLFIHGYNVSFEGAALRAAQIGFDLQVPGPMCFFSWPSMATLKDYLADEAAVEASEASLAAYIDALITETGASRVDVIAHSMGNRALLRALHRMRRAHGYSRTKLGMVILAAPDVDARVFADLARVYHDVAQRTTLYVSEKDSALELSGCLRNFPRAGFAPPTTTVDGIDTIHVGEVDLSLLGHGYVAEARTVLTDMHQFLAFQALPQERMALQAERTASGATCWRLRS